MNRKEATKEFFQPVLKWHIPIEMMEYNVVLL